MDTGLDTLLGLDFHLGDGSGPLSRLMRDGALRCVFQPIVDMRDGSIHAHEALVRGPAAMPLHSADALFAAARKEGLLLKFELACVELALGRWAELRQPGRLFVNVSATALTAAIQRRSIHALVGDLGRLGLAPRMLTLEITEHEHVSNVDAFVRCVREMQAAGIAFALDDFGDGRSSLRLWSELEPDTVKIDKYFTRDISCHAKKAQTVRALMQIADVFGTSLVAEGIETADDLRVIRDLGITWGQGYFLGRPAPEPRTALRSAASPGRLRELGVLHAEPITSSTTNDELWAIFQRHVDWPAVAVVENEIPVGLIERHQFLDRYARNYFKEIYGKKPAMYFANTTPRLLERDRDVRELIGILTSNDQRYLTEGLIVVENGRYLGLGTAEQLVRNVTESRVEAARHANPLTLLPGNIPTTEHISRLLKAGGDFVVAYADLRNFKPFNDHSGYWRGDEMIKLVASMLLAHCDPQRDFIGHVGGDDFLLVFQDDAWQARCEQIVAEFNRAAVFLYDDAARAAGGIDSEDRRGNPCFFEFTTLYVGAVVVSGGQFEHAERVANAAARAKQAAKAGDLGLVVHCGRETDSSLAPLASH
jgi:EAL domain-containing protein (putative c-di-GMP-specific phosphodiesterase class I)/GGDEF domain-containing protein